MDFNEFLNMKIYLLVQLRKRLIIKNTQFVISINTLLFSEFFIKELARSVVVHTFFDKKFFD